MALHLFIYLLGSLSPLPQPIEAIAGVQPVVGVVVLTHPLPTAPTFHSSLFLLFCVSAPSARFACLPLLSGTKQADLSPLWSSLSGCVERRAGRRWGGEWSGRGRREEGGEGRAHNGVAMAAAATSVYLETLLVNQNSRHTRMNTHTHVAAVCVSCFQFQFQKLECECCRTGEAFASFACVLQCVELSQPPYFSLFSDTS